MSDRNVLLRDLAINTAATSTGALAEVIVRLEQAAAAIDIEAETATIRTGPVENFAASDAVISELEEQIKQQQAALDAARKEEQLQKQHLDKATEYMSKYSATIAELEEQIGALNRQVDAQFTAIEARDAENTKLSENVVTLHEEIEERTRELETAKNTLYATRLDLNQARKDLADTAANRGDHAERADTLAEKLAAVEAELDDARAAAEAAESLAEEHRTHAVEAKRQLADALGEQKQLAKQAKADAKTIQDLTGQLADAQQSPMGNTAPVPDAAAEKARALVTRAIRTLTNSGGLYDLEKDDAVIVSLREATSQLTNRPPTDATAPGKEATE